MSNAAGTTASGGRILSTVTSAQYPVFFGGPRTLVAQTGVPFTHQIFVRESTFPLTYTASPLPPGLTLNGNTGLISGTPASAGTSVVNFSAANSGGTLASTITITVTDAPPAIPIESWRYTNFGAASISRMVASDNANPNGDGIPNLFAYALGLNPLVPGTQPLTTQIQGRLSDPHCTRQSECDRDHLECVGQPGLGGLEHGKRHRFAEQFGRFQSGIQYACFFGRGRLSKDSNHRSVISR